jgi:replication factor C large subunit
MQPWVVKHKPASASDIPQPGMVKLKNFLSNFQSNGRKKTKAALIHGPAGSCKSCAVYSIAQELGLEVFELNASDFRTAEMVEQRLGGAALQMSLFSKGKIILVDEVDGLAGREDRGGIAAVAKLIEKTAFPVVLTANNPWDQKFSPLRSKSQLIEFEPINSIAAYNILKGICEKEKLEYEESALKELAAKSNGDLRAAINDLQSLSANPITKKTIESMSHRDTTQSIIAALAIILRETNPDKAVAAFDSVEEDLERSFLWIDENLPKEYKNPKELADAYDAVSRADVYMGRIRKRQHWRFLTYANTMLTAGVAVAKSQKHGSFVSYSPTTRILKLWRAGMKYQQRKSIAKKLAEKTHTSTRKAINTMSYFPMLFRDKALANSLASELKLDEEEIDWLQSS